MTFRNPLRLLGATAFTLLAAACADQPTAPLAPDIDGPRLAIVNTAKLGNFVWHDLNANGIQDSGEPGIVNADIQFYPNGATTPIIGHSKVTPAGEYLIQGLAPGSYKVCVPLPTGFTGISMAAQGGNGALDSDGTGPDNCVTVSLAEGEVNLDLDFGFYKTAALGDYVWFDANGNGVQENGEPGIEGATVTLAGPSGPQSMVTTAGGAYGFTNLLPGDYTVCVDTPTGYSAASLALQGGNPVLDSDGVGSPNCASVAIASGDNNLTIDFGFTLSRASLGDFVWHDLNGDGVQDAGEPGIPGATVTLAGPSGPQSMQTTATGAYGFTNLLPGSYTVCTAMPAGYSRISAANQGGDGTADSDGQGAQNCVTVTLAPGESNPTLDFGFYKLGALGDFVWSDLNNNGIQDNGEAGISGATVTLDGPGGPQSQVTNGSGSYLFTNLAPGSYTVCVAIPAGFSAVSPDGVGAPSTDSNGSGTPNCDTVTLTSGQIDLTIDFGFTIARAALGDFVWHDINANGIQDNGEPGITDAVVTLSGGPSSAAPVSTNATGDYAFSNLLPGTYTVCVAMPAGYTAISPANQGGDQTKDSNGSGAGNCTQATLAAGDNNITLDFGFYTPVALGDFVWHDLNANGVQDLGEPGINGATVTMTGPSGPQSMATDATGYYQFTNLLPGTYTVCVAMPAGFTQISQANQGGDQAKDSNGQGAGNCTSSTVLSGNTDETLDFGFYKLGSIGNYVWADANSDGKQDGTEVGIVGATVTMTGPGGPYTQQTVAGGAYLFTGLKPGTYVVCVAVPLGYSGASPANVGGDDAKDSNGAGAGNCSTVLLPSGKDDLTIDFGFTKAVVLLGSIGDFVWHDLNADGKQDAGEPGIAGATVTATGPGGPFSTTTNSAGIYSFTGLGAGTYVVCVAMPAGYQGISTALQGGDATKDSNGAGSPNCGSVTIAAGATDITIDFGFYKLASLGDFTWYDKNDNGIQNGGYEVGMNGVKLTLYLNNVVVGTQTSANGGKYLFTNLKPGSYIVCSTIPSGYHASAAVQGNDRAIDSNGAGTGNCSAAVVLASGETNLTVDFGFDCGTASPTLASVGDFVWRDTNGNGVQDSGEAGIKGVTLTLTGTNTNKTTTTDSYGKYLFSGLNAGTYKICVSTVSGLIPTGSDKGSNDAKDSDGIGSPNCASVTLSAGENDMTIDFGFDCAPTPASLSGYVWSDANLNGIQNSGESPISGRTVTLNGPSGSKTTTTNSSGRYTFSNLLPGTYTVCSAVPTNYTASPANQGSGEGVDSDGSGTGNCATVTLAAGEQKDDPDFGSYCKPVTTGSIGSFVWNDSNMNGIQNSGENGLSGRTVTLTGAANKTTTTDSNGKYSFTGLGAGTYTVCVAAPSGYAATGADKSADDAVDSDGKGTGNCASVTLVAGQTNNNMDFGFFCANGSIGSFVWYDKDYDGIQESSEYGMSGRTVTLSGNNISKTATTNSSGGYSFGSLPAGTYSVCVAVPSGYKASPANKGYYDSKDSDGSGTNNCASVTLSAGQSNTTIDFGFDQK